MKMHRSCHLGAAGHAKIHKNCIPGAREVLKNLPGDRGFVAIQYGPVASHGDPIHSQSCGLGKCAHFVLLNTRHFLRLSTRNFLFLNTRHVLCLITRNVLSLKARRSLWIKSSMCGCSVASGILTAVALLPRPVCLPICILSCYRCLLGSLPSQGVVCAIDGSERTYP